MMLTMMHIGRLIPVPPVEKAKRFLADQGPDLPLNRRMILGSPAAVRAGVEGLARDYAADEVLLVNILHDHAVRRRSYQLIADEFHLPRQPA
jgi:alkanesulfonate monooxygenase SsuD/methylene tetrahydromethanopterin reductase-like flavin-dependent oxidoreductase (luciferase family)